MIVKTCVNSAPDALALLRSDTSKSSSPVGEYSTRNKLSSDHLTVSSFSTVPTIQSGYGKLILFFSTVSTL